ncbi:MAG TPA: lamin tail domain-containing protein, partial [Pyrinomonadaceae bacterium]|nr:lamin tail domain-containing protein [Pyrinomonadaceae bacterium]
MPYLRTHIKFSARFFALVGTLFVSMMIGGTAQAQTTIVNYDFNAGTSYATLTPVTAPGVTSTASSTEAFVTFGGTATTPAAFTQNPTAGNALAMNNSSGTNTRYFQFQLGGPALVNYASYKIYFQAQRSGTGAQVITLAYSTDGTNFTNFPTTGAPGNGSFNAILFDLSAVTALNNRSSITFRLLASSASGTGTLRIDNFQVQAVNSPPPLIISEFRTFGPTGTCDEFVELYNTRSTPYTVQAADNSPGFAVAQSNGNVLFTIPNGTVIPARGHYLAVNNGGGPCTGSFSGSAYPAGSPSPTATGDNTLNEDIPANAGIAIFNTSIQGSFNTDNRLDAVGPTTAPALYKEGTGYPTIFVGPINYSIYRDARSGVPQDTNNNETDFRIVEADLNQICTPTANFQCQRLGAPGPENTSSPVQRNADIKASLVDTQCTGMRVNPTLTPGVYQASACRFERRTDAGSGFGASPTSLGTISIRRRFTNTTGVQITRLRFRIVDITTFPDSVLTPGNADLRAITSAQVTAVCQNEGGTSHLCSDNASSTTTIEGTTLETDANGQANGGGFNSTLSLATPLAAGASINVQFLLGVE